MSDEQSDTRECLGDTSCSAQVMPGDICILGSDGLFDNVSEEEMLEEVRLLMPWYRTLTARVCAFPTCRHDSQHAVTHLHKPQHRGCLKA